MWCDFYSWYNYYVLDFETKIVFVIWLYLSTFLSEAFIYRPYYSLLFRSDILQGRMYRIDHCTNQILYLERTQRKQNAILKLGTAKCTSVNNMLMKLHENLPSISCYANKTTFEFDAGQSTPTEKEHWDRALRFSSLHLYKIESLCHAHIYVTHSIGVTIGICRISNSNALNTLSNINWE